ncbi:alpha/beta hydrolase [Desulfocarbo indianensis]|nr:alpha/beta hydrolase [Desulfocarbo indianensis]
MRLVILISALIWGLLATAEAAQPIALPVNGGALYGALEVPAGAQPWPVALIIAGSGPTDRDGNSALAGRNDSLKLLAQGLAAKGVASLRYDKRGVAASALAGLNEADLRFDSYIEDAVKWGGLLSRDERFTQLIIIGHSEGALIGAIACRRLGAQGFISIAGAGYPAYEVLETQLRKNLPPGLLAESDRILASLKAGQTTDKVPPPLLTLFRPSVQPYLISWFRYDPAREIAKLKAPCLIVQGATDIQVGASDAERLAKANKLAQLLIIKGMNHVLKIVPLDPALQMKSYGDPDLPVAQELLDGMAAFIAEVSHKE